MSFRALVLALSFLVTPALSRPVAAELAVLTWADWSPEQFARAKAENRFVLLDLHAVWCHWCHVMEETTYRDPEVVELIESRYLPVRVDQDAHPDLSNRYEDYGWPATIVFAPDGTELVKRRGYIPPDQFAALLQAIIDDPSPGPSVVTIEPVEPNANAVLDPGRQKEIFDDYFALYDTERGGWGTHQKFIEADSIEFALRGAMRGDARRAAMARQTLDAAIALIDPVWGGVYQYSVGPTWNDPHFEKIMSFQASYLRAYSLAYGLWGDDKYRKTAELIARYLTEFLSSPDSAFYVSQDADVSRGFTGKQFYALNDAERRAGPMPRIDQHIYARENGWAISALSSHANIAGDKSALDHARRAARYVLTRHRRADGGFAHDAAERTDPAPHLGDSLYMADALLSLYSATAEREWLQHAREAMDFVESNFREPRGGFVTSPISTDAVGVFKTPVKQLDENIAVARTANLLFHYTGDARYKAVAEHAMRYLASPQLRKSRLLLPGVLLAAEELGEDPLHVTVIGGKEDPAAHTLFLEALRWPTLYKRIEWWDRSEGPLPNADVQYPVLNRSAAFLCTNKTCSLPMFTTEALSKRLRAVAAETAVSTLSGRSRAAVQRAMSLVGAFASDRASNHGVTTYRES